MEEKLTAIAESIGHTPLLSFIVRFGDVSHQMYVKAEWMNPTGSMKDRTALGLILDLVSSGRLSPTKKVIESSSGNLALGLANICDQLGVELVVVVDPLLSVNKRARLARYKYLKLDMVRMPDRLGSYLSARQHRVFDRMAGDPELVWTNQYEAESNPRSHYVGTAAELIAHFGQDGVDAIFVPVSTGGTFAGIRQRYAESGASATVVPVDVLGSRALGGESGPRFFTGIGSSRISRFLNPEELSNTSVSRVHESELVSMVGVMSAVYDSPLGPSTHAVLLAALRYLDGQIRSKSVVCIGADSGEDYMSTLYDHAWVTSRGLQSSRRPISSTCELSYEGVIAR